MQSNKTATSENDLEDGDIKSVTSLKQLIVHKVLGKGAFGVVSLVSMTQDGPRYAVKAIDKS